MNSKKDSICSSNFNNMKVMCQTTMMMTKMMKNNNNLIEGKSQSQ
jgi:hypothetical protein